MVRINTRKKLEEFGYPSIDALADVLSMDGLKAATIDEDVIERKSVTVKLDSDLVAKIDDYAVKAKATRTSIIEILLTGGLQSIDKRIERNRQSELEFDKADSEEVA